MQSRRSALIKIATATASVAVAPLFGETGAMDHLHMMVDTPAGPQLPKYFNEADYKTLTRLVDLIIPRTETPGAADAGVQFWIDRRVLATAELQEQFKTGLAQLSEQSRAVNGAEFTAMTESQQVNLLETMAKSSDAPGNTFFTTVRNLTVDEYYTSEPGLVQELGYHGNTYLTSFEGCTHPEHWPTEKA